MPTYSKEIPIYDPDAISDGIADASGKAENYISTVDQTGIMVHPASDSTSGWRISSAIELLKSGTRYIKAWLNGSGNSAVPTVRLGQDTSGHTDVTPSGLQVHVDSGASVAEFGATSRIGRATTSHIAQSGNETAFYGPNGTDVLARMYTRNDDALLEFPSAQAPGYDDHSLIVAGYEGTELPNGTTVWAPSLGLQAFSANHANTEPSVYLRADGPNGMCEVDVRDTGVNINGDSEVTGDLTVDGDTNLYGSVSGTAPRLFTDSVSGSSAATPIAAGNRASINVPLNSNVPSGYVICGLRSITNDVGNISIYSFARSNDGWTVGVKNEKSESQRVTITVTAFAIKCDWA